jgi:hypothetical protein
MATMAFSAGLLYLLHFLYLLYFINLLAPPAILFR